MTKIPVIIGALLTLGLYLFLNFSDSVINALEYFKALSAPIELVPLGLFVAEPLSDER